MERRGGQAHPGRSCAVRLAHSRVIALISSLFVIRSVPLRAVLRVPRSNIGTEERAAITLLQAPRHGRRSRVVAAVFAMAAGAASVTTAPACAAVPPLSGDYRLLLRFAEDGAVIRKGWIEAYGDARRSASGDDLGAHLRAAFRFGRDTEAGVDLGGLRRRRDAGADLYGAVVPEDFSHAGLGDALVYGKYRLLRGPCDLALGASLTVPLADDDSGLTPGAVQAKGFVALRGSVGGTALVGHLGVVSAGDAHYEEGAQGRTAGTVSFGALWPLGRLWTLLAEADHSGALWENDGPTTRGLVGLDWRPTENIVVRGGLGAGREEKTDQVSGTVAMAFHF
jgi:hypothetical protein